jgi:hypothetical protein
VPALLLNRSETLDEEFNGRSTFRKQILFAREFLATGSQKKCEDVKFPT